MLRKLFLSAVIAVLLVTVQAGRADAYIVTNGGFTTGDFNGWTLGGDTTNPLAWYTVNSDGFLPNPNYAQVGTAGLRITLSQLLTAAVAGQAYAVSFFVKNDLPASPSTFQVLWNGVSQINLTTGMSSAWTPYSFTATAVGSDVLTFNFLHDTATINLTNVSAAPVPIPGALLLFAPGLAGLAVVRRRLRK